MSEFNATVSWANISKNFYLEKRRAVYERYSSGVKETVDVLGLVMTHILMIQPMFVGFYVPLFAFFDACRVLLSCWRETHSCALSPQSDYHFEYTECDILGSRWRVAIPNKADTCTGLPNPVKGTQCSKCPSLSQLKWLQISN